MAVAFRSAVQRIARYSLEIAMHDSTVENLPNHDLLVKEATKSAQWATGKDPCASVGDDESKMYQEVARNVEKILTFYVRRRDLEISTEVL